MSLPLRSCTFQPHRVAALLSHAECNNFAQILQRNNTFRGWRNILPVLRDLCCTSVRKLIRTLRQVRSSALQQVVEGTMQYAQMHTRLVQRLCCNQHSYGSAECDQDNCLGACLPCGWVLFSQSSMQAAAGSLAGRSEAGMGASALMCSHRFWTQVEA